MSASEFLRQKYEWLFHFFDHSKNGSIDIGDLRSRAERAVESIKEFYAQQEGGPEFLTENLEKIRAAQVSAHEHFFEGLCSEVDQSKDKSISFDEWVKFCEKIRETVSSTGSLPEWFSKVLTEYFDSVLDFDGNGFIDLYELSFMGDAPLDVAWFCFNYLTRGGEEPLTKEAFVDFTTKYLSCEDPQDVSRYMFGFIPMPSA